MWDCICDLARRFVDYAKFFAAPTYACHEIDIGFGSGWDGRGRIRLPHNHVLEIGKEALAPLTELTIDVDADIVDLNGDGLFDTVECSFDATLLPAGATVDELILVVPEDQAQFDECAPDSFWRREIRPAKFALSADGETVNVTFRSWLTVQRALYAGMVPSILDPQDTSIYLTTIQVWRRYTDVTGAVQLWRRPNVCNCVDTDGACYECEDGAACLLNREMGMVELTLDRNLNCIACKRCIDKVVIHYRSGDCNNEAVFARAVAGCMSRDLCCGKSHTELRHWQEDFVRQTDEGRFTRAISRSERRSGLGTTRGALDLYTYLRSRRHIKVLRV